MARLFGTMLAQWNDHNLLAYSELLSSWTQVNAPVLTADQADPWGGIRAFLINDNDGGAQERVDQTLAAYAVTGQKGVSIIYKKGTSPAAAGSSLVLRDTDAPADRMKAVLTWSGDTPSWAMTTGTELWNRQWLDGWWRAAFLSTSCTAGNAHDLQLAPAETVAQTGDLYVCGLTAVDVATVGGYVRTRGTALTYDDELTPAQSHELRVPLQQVRPAGSLWRSVSRSMDRKVREVTTVGRGVEEAVGIIRYDDLPQELNDMIRAGVQGFPICLIPDDTDMDAAVEVDLLEPGEEWALDFDVDQMSFDEHRQAIRVARLDGGSLSTLF